MVAFNAPAVVGLVEYCGPFDCNLALLYGCFSDHSLNCIVKGRVVVQVAPC